MVADVQELPRLPSSREHLKDSIYLATVATLVSIALLTSLLRVFTRGKVLRSFGIDDVLAFFALLCTIGATATYLSHLRLEMQEDVPKDLPNSQMLLFVTNLIHTFGIGFVKISVSAFLISRTQQRTCRRVLYVLIVTLSVLTLFWFFSTLLRCSAIGILFQDQQSLRCISPATCVVLDLVNHITNAASDILLISISIVFAIHTASPQPHRALLLLPLCFAIAATSAAIARTCTLFHTSSPTNEATHNISNPSSPPWQLIELATALTAADLLTLSPLLAFLLSSRSTASHSPSLPPYVSPRTSTQTIIHRPSLARFHDTISNLDFDIESLATTRTRTHTMRSRTTRGGHSRNVSDWSQFSGFTYYTSPSEAADGADASFVELGELVKELGLSGKEFEGEVERQDERDEEEFAKKAPGEREVVIRTRAVRCVSFDDGRQVGVVEDEEEEDARSMDEGGSIVDVDVRKTRGLE
ncbi:hypothetical protein ACN47E_000842 [Coniothyrium glycines]